MSQTVADLPTFLHNADRGLKDAVLSALLAERMAARPGQPLDVPGVGTVVPFGPPGKCPSPFDAPAEAATLRTRMTTLDDAVSLEDLRTRVEAAVRRSLAAPSAGSGVSGTGGGSPAPRT